jgi:hypothetical protein
MPNPTTEVRNSFDLKGLETVLQGLAGQVCWMAKLTYGDELALHFGDRIPCGIPRFPGLEEGSWIFGTRATPWQLDVPGKSRVTSADDRNVLQPRLADLEGAKVVRAAVPTCVLNEQAHATQSFWPGFLIVFDNGATLQLLPGIEELRDTLALWELFTPGNMVLEFDPNLAWSYLRADVPEGADASTAQSITSTP